MKPRSPYDDFLPAWDFRERHRRRVAASRERTWAALQSLDLSRSWLVRALYRLRGMPRSALTLARLERLCFVRLAEVPGEELLLGVAGRFWTRDGGLVELDPAGFRNFARPGYARAVWGFELSDGGAGRTLLTTETRVHCTDATARRRFRRYWWLVRPASGLLRRAALAEIARRAETPAANP
jgi:hypothetical protein